MSDAASELLLTIRASVAWLTFNRPQKANALTVDMLQALQRSLERCVRDDTVRAIVLTGAGNRTFSAGADLTPPTQDAAAHAAQRRAAFAQTLFALIDFDKPAVAAVNGAACGAGMMLALLCDAAIAADGARFALPEIAKGLPTLPGITIVRQRFNDALAADLTLSGRFMSAQEAAARGLLREIVAPDKLAEHAQALAIALGRNDARAYAHNKRWLNRSLREELAAALDASRKLHADYEGNSNDR